MPPPPPSQAPAAAPAPAPARDPAPAADGEQWVLRLYIAGETPKSARAVANLRAICAGDAGARFRVEVIDLLREPEMARRDQIVAIPTLVRKLPPPLRRIIGDLSDREKVLVGLDLREG